MTRAANLPDPLTRYRINSQGLTAGGEAHDPRGRTHEIREAEWARLGLTYDLYDDHPAAEISALLRDEGLPVVGSRMPAYRTVLTVLGALLRDSRRRAPVRDRAERRTAGRDADGCRWWRSRPPALTGVAGCTRSAAPVDKQAARAAGTERLLDPAYLPAP